MDYAPILSLYSHVIFKITLLSALERDSAKLRSPSLNPAHVYRAAQRNPECS